MDILKTKRTACLWVALITGVGTSWLCGVCVYAVPPVNDDCSNAHPVTAGTENLGTTVDATGSDLSSCSLNDFKDVWFLYIPPTSGVNEIHLCNAYYFDSTLSVFDGCGGAELACNDDYCAQSSYLSIHVRAGESYYIRVAGYNGDEGNFNLTVGVPVPPANDECVNATVLADNVVIAGSNIGATGTDLSSCSFFDEHDVWYVYTPAESGLADINLCDGSVLDSTLSVFDACNGTELACNDDYCGTASQIILPVTRGTQYFLRIAGYYNLEDTFTLKALTWPGRGVLKVAVFSLGVDEATQVPIPEAFVTIYDHAYNPVSSGIMGPSGEYEFMLLEDVYELRVTAPSHVGEIAFDISVLAGTTTQHHFYLRMTGTDECADAPFLFEGEFRSGTNAGATGVPLINCCFDDTSDVWWRYTPPEDGIAIFTCAYDFDGTLGLFDACGGNELKCNDDFGPGDPETIIDYVEQGVTYYVRIAGRNGTTGNYVMNVYRTAAQRDEFPNSRVYLRLQWPSGVNEIIKLTGSSEMEVYYTGIAPGSAADTNGNGKEEVSSTLRSLYVSGTSGTGGQTILKLRTPLATSGVIEEDLGTVTNVLEIPPFTVTGTAEGILQAYFELTTSGVILHNDISEDLSATLTHLPPNPGDLYTGTNSIDMLDANGQPTGVSIRGMTYEPNPVEGEGTLQGNVYNANTLKPVPGATVALAQGALEFDSRTTGPAGAYAFEPVPAGLYDMHVSAPRYTDVVITGVEVIQGTTTLQDFGLTSTNTPPVANAGPDQEHSIETMIYLDGSASSDVDGDTLIYTWTFLEKPVTSNAYLNNPGTHNPFFVLDVPGSYVLQLIVNDGIDDSEPDTVVILGTGGNEGEGEMEVGICPENALFGQSPFPSPLAPIPYLSEGYRGFRVYDDFYLPDCIDTVRWWGIESTDSDPCVRDAPTFQIDFIEDIGGLPAGTWVTQGVTATRSNTGATVYGHPVHLYEARLDSPMCLSYGWVSIIGVGESDCSFRWYLSETGNLTAYQDWPGEPLTPISTDMAVCLSWTGGEGEGEPPVPHPADTNVDFRMVLSEAIAYLAGWQQGSNLIGYAIRAAYLWQNGEHYIYDAGQAPPICWVLAP